MSLLPFLIRETSKLYPRNILNFVLLQLFIATNLSLAPMSRYNTFTNQPPSRIYPLHPGKWTQVTFSPQVNRFGLYFPTNMRMVHRFQYVCWFCLYTMESFCLVGNSLFKPIDWRGGPTGHLCTREWVYEGESLSDNTGIPKNMQHCNKYYIHCMLVRHLYWMTFINIPNQTFKFGILQNKFHSTGQRYGEPQVPYMPSCVGRQFGRPIF